MNDPRVRERLARIAAGPKREWQRRVAEEFAADSALCTQALLWLHAESSSHAARERSAVSGVLGSVISSAVKELVATRVDTLAKLELVVRLHGAPRSTMRLDELAVVLREPRDAVRRIVLELGAASLVVLSSVDDVQLLPPNMADAIAVAELAQLYVDNPLQLAALMSSPK